jgi:hypothetical protein
MTLHEVTISFNLYVDYILNCKCGYQFMDKSYEKQKGIAYEHLKHYGFPKESIVEKSLTGGGLMIYPNPERINEDNVQINTSPKKQIGGWVEPEWLAATLVGGYFNTTIQDYDVYNIVKLLKIAGVIDDD